MSTFDGIVDEFPNIRIDYFRYHPGKVSPAACFLSHVHSDHLQGLESLKMPFVYCSLATKSVLLRMEKYPHRINFAKGILEARKQSYKALKSVLRALPLEAPVDIELGPKSRIRVTLFDANHCPGSVMFLIEGSNKAILYTGDVRAEPWWVNSIVRNPVLLPYSCGAKRLDCIYLDTTFASRSDIHEHFPSKADGIKELLAKVSKCSKSSIFYFRAWTLGYEDVWIALSSYLQTQVHVDDYQLRLFRSLADDTQNTDRGPVLAGFAFGNQQQPGCLTDHSTVPIHSCEPGTDCYNRLKTKDNLVWITPIISRLKDGTEIAEVGAGGGGGDLYQTPELEVIDEAAFDALEQLYAKDPKPVAGLAKLGDALVAARAKGQSKIPLQGLELEQDEEISLKQFLRLVSRNDAEPTDIAEAKERKIIHFPYSRHSSYSELCHFISSFRPKDICPCTIDIDTWTEEVSIQALFGDMCSEETFRYDQVARLQAKERQEARGRKRKRKRGEDATDSQNPDSQTSTDTKSAYRSAQTSLQKEDKPTIPTNAHERSFAQGLPLKIPTPVRELQRALAGNFDRASKEEMYTKNTELGARQTLNDLLPPASHNGHTTTDNIPNISSLPISDSLMHVSSSDVYSSDDDDSDNEDYGDSIPPSLFQPIDMDDDQEATTHTPIGKSRLRTGQLVRSVDRAMARRRAYSAARLAMQNSDPKEWTDLRLRSVGWKGHSEEEIELA